LTNPRQISYTSTNLLSILRRLVEGFHLLSDSLFTLLRKEKASFYDQWSYALREAISERV
jgi:hypothetical protein